MKRTKYGFEVEGKGMYAQEQVKYEYRYTNDIEKAFGVYDIFLLMNKHEYNVCCGKYGKDNVRIFSFDVETIVDNKVIIETPPKRTKYYDPN